MLAPLLAFALVVGAPPAPDGVDRLNAAYAKAMLTGDADAAAALYATDGIAIFNGHEVRGRAAILQDRREYLGTYRITEFKITESNILTKGDLSTGWGRWSMTRAPKSGGASEHRDGWYTATAKKVDGKWLFVVDHSSSQLEQPPPATTLK